MVQHHHKAQLVMAGLCVWDGCIKSIGLIMDATDSGIDAEALSCILYQNLSPNFMDST